MGTVIDKLCNLLDQQEALMLQYEKATLALIETGPDDAEHYIIERERLATEVDALLDQMGWLCAEEPDGAVLLETVRGRTQLARLPGEYHPLYHAAQAVQSTVARILQSNEQALQRLEQLRGDALEQIKQHQNLPKIRKYLTGLTDGGDKLNLHEGKA